MIRAVLYDLDGTLLDLEPALQPARRAALRELFAGAPPARADLCFRRIRNRFTFADYADVLRGVALELGGRPRRAGRAERVFVRTLVERVRWFPGARRTVLELRRRGLVLGLISTGLSRYQRPKIRRFGLGRLFKPHLYVSGELGAAAAKPTTAMFRAFLRQTETPPRQVLMVGNQVDDVLGAHLAGMSAALFAPGRLQYQPRVKLERPDLILRSHRDVMRIVGRPDSRRSV
jgi:putative hydrolase of the HAD superfamily